MADEHNVDRFAKLKLQHGLDAAQFLLQRRQPGIRVLLNAFEPCAQPLAEIDLL